MWDDAGREARPVLHTQYWNILRMEDSRVKNQLMAWDLKKKKTFSALMDFKIFLLYFAVMFMS